MQEGTEQVQLEPGGHQEEGGLLQVGHRSWGGQGEGGVFLGFHQPRTKPPGSHRKVYVCPWISMY